MHIAIVCYASVGGSGVVATELAQALALRGHEVHVLSSELPFRWRDASRACRSYASTCRPIRCFASRSTCSALTNTIVQRGARAHALDIIHAHYAVPHATAALPGARDARPHGAGARRGR